MKLTKTERRYMASLVLYGWRIEEWGKDRWFLDGDSTLPVRVGAVAAALENKRLLERLHIGSYGILRHTALATAYRCRAPRCYRGRLIDGDVVDSHSPVCPACDGIGICAEPTNGTSTGNRTMVE